MLPLTGRSQFWRGCERRLAASAGDCWFWKGRRTWRQRPPCSLGRRSQSRRPLFDWPAPWAVVTGALLLAAAHRLAAPHGRWILVLAGVASAGWGALAAAADAGNPHTIRLWLVGYAVIFGGVLLALADQLRKRHWESAAVAG